MNMHYITKSLFVGATVACIGMSSEKADVRIPQSLRNEIRDLVASRLEACYHQVRDVVPNIYSEEDWEDFQRRDAHDLFGLILDRRFGYFHFCSLETMERSFQSRNEWERDFRAFFRNHCPLYDQSVRFLGADIRRESLRLFKILGSIVGNGYGWNSRLKNWANSRALWQAGVLDRDDFGFSVKHAFVFNDDFIGRIADIVSNAMTVTCKLYEFTQGISVENNALLKAYLGSVRKLYVRYLMLKDALRREEVTVEMCGSFVRDAKTCSRCDHRMSSYSESPEAKHTIFYMGGNENYDVVFRRAAKEVQRWQMEFEVVLKRLVRDPYWFRPRIDAQQGADILRELEG